MPRAVIVLEAVRDDDGAITTFRCVEVNEAGAASLGLPADALRGRTAAEMPALKVHPAVVRNCHEAVTTGEDRAWVDEIDLPARGRRRLRTTVVPSGDVVVALVEDVTDEWVEDTRQDTLLASAPMMVSIVDAEGAVTWASEGTRQVLGREPEELLGPPQLDKLHPDDADALIDGVLNMRARRRGVDARVGGDMEYRIRHADGRWRWINFVVENFTGVEGIDGVVCYGQDVTEQRLAADYAALDAEIHGAIVAGTPFDLVLQSLCDRLIGIVDATVVWVGLAEPDGAVVVRGAAGPIDDLFRGVTPRWDDTPVGRGPVGECIRTRRTITMRADDPALSNLDDRVAAALGRLGISGGVAIPLVADDLVVGALGVNVDDPAKLDDATVQTLEGIASWIAVSISMNRGRQRERLLAAALSAAANAVAITDARGRITWVNEAFTTTTGIAFVDAVGHIPEPLDDPLGRSAQAREMWSAIGNNRSWSGEVIGHRSDGAAYRAIKTVTPLFSAADEIEHFVVIEEDISELRATEQRLERATTRDTLTGLPNRAAFLERLDATLAGSGGWTVVACLNIDQFRQVNERDGMEAGDRALMGVADRLLALVRQEDLVSRLGGDSFALAVTGIADRAQAVQRLEQVRARLERSNREHRGQVLSTGVVVVDPSGRVQRAADVLGDAELAMRSAKGAGPGGFAYFDESIRAEVQDRLALLADLERAIAAGDLLVHYQPQFEIRTGRLVGVEALVRWHHPERGMLPPGDFLGLAEDAGLVPDLDRFVRTTALTQLGTWLHRYPAERVPEMSVNLSPLEFAAPGIAEQIASEIAAVGCPPEKVTVEILETSIVTDEAAGTVQALSDRGVRLAIDDFGTGYSSLAYLAQLPVDELKIDRSFVERLDQPDDRARTVVAATVALGHQLGLEVTAEGVETAEQEAALSAMGCDHVQGYLRSRPVPAETVEALIVELGGRRSQAG